MRLERNYIKQEVFDSQKERSKVKHNEESYLQKNNIAVS